MLVGVQVRCVNRGKLGGNGLNPRTLPEATARDMDAVPVQLVASAESE